MQQLLACDIDGVLRASRDDPKILQVTEASLEALQRKGVLTTLCTGEGYIRSIAAMRKFRPDTLMIVEEVKVVKPSGDDGLIVHAPVIDRRSIQALERVMGVVEKAVFCPRKGHSYFVLAPKGDHDGIRKKHGPLIQEMTDDPGQFLACAVPQAFGTCKITMRPPQGKTLVLPESVHTTKSEEYTSVLPRGWNKGTALYYVCAVLGIALSDVVVCVNDWNDLAMARFIALSGGIVVTVGDRVEELCKLATRRVDTPEELPATLAAIFPEILRKT